MKRLLTIPFCLLLLGACTSAAATPEPPKNTDPRKGAVEINIAGYRVYKQCDGLTLVYVMYSNGITVAENSPECKPQ